MMNREILIDQVKKEYARLAAMEHTIQSSGNPDAYYEDLLGQVLHRIEQGRFDQFGSGREIVEAVANNKSRRDIDI